MGAMGETTSKLGGLLTRWLGAAAIGALIKSSVTEFAKLDRSFTALRIQLDGLGQDAATNLPKIRAFLEEISASGGGLVAETLPAFRTFLGLTKQVNTAMSLTQLASNMAESGMGDLASATSVLSGILSGQASRGLKDWGVNVREAADGTVQADKAMGLMYDAFPKRNSEIVDAQNQIDILSDRWERFKLTIGEATAATANFYIDGLSTVGKFFRDLPEEIAIGGLMTKGFLKSLGPALAETFNFKRIIFGGPGGISAAFAKGFEEVQPEIDALRAKVRAKDVDAAAASGKEQGAAEAKAKAEAIRIAGEKGRQEAEAAEKKAAEQRIDDYMQLNAKRVAQEVADFHTRMGLVKEYQEVADKAKDDQIATDAEAYQASQQHAERMRDLEAGLIQDRLSNDDLTLQSRKELALKLIDLDEARLKAATFNADEITAIEARAAADRVRVERAAAAAKTQIAFAVARGAIEVGDQIFENNKWLALANSLINALEAASAAAKVSASAGPYAAIAAYVSTFAFVIQAYKTIKGVHKGGASGGKGTFDGPVNDQVARVGTKKSAEDFVRLSQEGIGLGMRSAFNLPAPGQAGGGDAAGAGGGASLIVYGNVYGGEPGLRQLRRDLERAGRLDQNRKLR